MNVCLARAQFGAAGHTAKIVSLHHLLPDGLPLNGPEGGAA
jgi:hypothetical protein